jgi:hypothetical protein
MGGRRPKSTGHPDVRLEREGAMANPDVTAQAMADVESVLGPDVYVLAPKADYFLGEAVLAATAGLLIESFLRGFTEGLGLQKRVEP